MSHIRIDRDGATSTITLARPERFNAMDVRTAQDFRRAVAQLARDDTSAVIVLKGLAGMFCTGAEDDVSREQTVEFLHGAVSEIRRAPKPFIAAVDGVAAAAGFAIAMSCDLVIASTRASFEWAYTKTGLAAVESSTFLLPKLIGFRRAMGMLLLNPRVAAEQALAYGLVNEVHDVERFELRVADASRQLTAGPRNEFAAAKALLNQASGMDGLEAHLEQSLAAAGD